MRTYPRNSPHAAARVVALVLLADGHLSRSEMALLQQRGMQDALGLPGGQLQQVLQHLAEDLVASGLATWSGTGLLHEEVVEGVLAEVTDPALRLRVQELCMAAASADQHRSEGEDAVLAALGRLWALPAPPVRHDALVAG